MEKKLKLILALIANAAVVVLELVALALSLMEHGLGNFAFYTQDSNYLAAAVILNILRVMEGPYPFLLVYAQPWYLSVLWCVVILGIAAILALGVRALYNFITKSKHKERSK